MQMNLKVNWDGGVFAVPDCAADGLKLASGKAVKVLLYIMRYKNDDDITERLGISEEDLEDAYSYWEQVGVLYKDGSVPAVNTVREASVSRSGEAQGDIRSSAKACKGCFSR